MNTSAKVVAAAFALSLALPLIPVSAQGPPPPPRFGQGPPQWDSPPREFTRAIQQQGFRDGMYGAGQDFKNRRPPNVMNRDEFRNYRGADRRVYRDAFQRGYNAWWNHQNPGRR